MFPDHVRCLISSTISNSIPESYIQVCVLCITVRETVPTEMKKLRSSAIMGDRHFAFLVVMFLLVHS